MFGKHVEKKLSAYHHHELPVEEAVRIEVHLRDCDRCSKAYEEIRFGARLAAFVKRVPAPPLDLSESGPPARRNWGMGEMMGMTMSAWAPLAACFLIAVSLSSLLWTHMPQPPSWAVVRIDSTGVEQPGRLRIGDKLETDSHTEARVRVADIGRLSIDPNTSIRLLETKEDEHRISLARGRMEAFIWAPPRLFFTETPSAVAVDLGCAYTLEVEEDGSSLLHVTLGLVSLELNGRESRVPRGAFCRTRPGSGPGTPFFDDSTPALQAALDLIDSHAGPEREGALETVLKESRPRDTLTLWHLLPRFDANSRERVFNRMAELVPVPSYVTREGVVGLNLEMLDAWRETLLNEVWW